jgi:hypothetical protein
VAIGSYQIVDIAAAWSGDADVVARGDVEEPGAIARLGDAHELGRPRGRLPWLREDGALRRHRQL